MTDFPLKMLELVSEHLKAFDSHSELFSYNNPFIV